MEDYVIRIIGFGVVLWTILFFMLRWTFPKLSLGSCNRLVSSAHACLAVFLASASVQDCSCPVCPLASVSSPKQMQTLSVSVAYLIYDTVCSLFEKEFMLDTAIHHVISIVGLAAGLSYQRCGSEMVAALWVTELSSPFLHLRGLLKEFGYRGTSFNLAADIGFAFIFKFARMIIGPYLTYITLTAPNPPLIKAMALGLQMVSTFWFYKIVGMVGFKLRTRSSSTKNKSH